MPPARHIQTIFFLASLAIALALGMVAGCGGGNDGGNGGDDGSGPGADAAVVSECEPRGGTDLGLELAAGGFDEPILAVAPPDDSRLFVVERAGVIKIVKSGQVLPQPFLDIDERVASGPLNNEQGLLGVAFHPEFAQNGRFFVYYTAEEDDVNSPLPANVVSEFHVMSGSPDLADPSSERRVIEVADQFSNHNGGMIEFGPDGTLTIGLGDGGDRDDPFGNGQDKTTLLGDMLRIDIDNTDAQDYGIPANNPYAASKDGERPEIFISGVRNPWRWSFDRQTGDLYIGDVGQGAEEEVDVLPAGQQSGANLGWDLMEGDICRSGPCGSELVRPVAVYDNPGDGRAVVGGYVYRGTCFTDIQGTYFYGDYVTDQVWTFRYAAGADVDPLEVTTVIDPDSVLDGLASFGQDALGELYAISIRSGEVYHIVARP